MNLFRLINRAFKYIFDSRYRVLFNASRGAYKKMPDEEYLKKIYKAKMGSVLDLKSPITFNEKLQWLKLNDRKNIYTKMVDKYEARGIVKEKIGEEHLVPLLGIWDKTSDINFNELKSRFVIKTTHGCGGMIICKDKNLLDKRQVRRKLNKSLKDNYYYHSREWPYKNIKPRVIAEEYLKNDNQDNLVVYKVFNFDGVPRIIQVIQDDKTLNESIDYFDTDWNLLDLKQNYPNSITHLQKPDQLNEMLKLSSICSKGFPFLRTDWYIVNNKIYFSEFTFYSDAGMEPFYPNDWDKKLGDYIMLGNIMHK